MRYQMERMVQYRRKVLMKKTVSAMVPGMEEDAAGMEGQEDNMFRYL